MNAQWKRILDYCDRHGSITPADAYNLGIMRLASRMYELKERGYTVTKVMEESTNRYGEPVRYARYTVQ